jgi:multiple sugar transport system ATP-binding protein
MASVSFRNVSKSYGPVTALDSLDLEIKAGEFVSLLGPSGSGKSTTLNILSGLQDADGGTVLIGDRDVTHLSPDKRDIALVFQNYALYPHMTVAENIAFPLEARRPRASADVVSRKVQATADSLGIGDLLARYPKEISGGQQQRVALGRAMVRDPKVFLLDEPLSNLDARLRIRMRRDLKALHSALKSTIVYVTHDQSEAMTLSDRIAIFNKGRLQQVATPHDIYNRPANLFVANFVGDRETNLLQGELVEEGGRRLVRGQAWSFVLSRPSTQISHRGAVTLGIRPEAVGFARPGDKDGIAGQVVHTELAGPDLYILAALSGGAEVSLRCEPGTSVSIGEQIALQMAEDRIHLFDPASGQCISHGAPPTGR